MTTEQDVPPAIPAWSLGDRLRKARMVAGLDREEMAADIGVTPRTISNYELDQTKAPKLVVRQYALRTGVPVEWLEDGYPGPGNGDKRTVTIGYSVISYEDFAVAA